MSLVRVTLDKPGPAGNVRSPGGIRATPTRRRTAGDAIVLPARFTAPLTEGVTIVELAPNGPDWCWFIEERVDGGTNRYVAVPDSATTLGYEDLVDVDPDTLDPAAEPVAAWYAALQTMPGWVTVVTGTETRPNTTAGVTWFDTRVDQSTPPANMTGIDIWATPSTSDTTNPTVPTGLASSAITDTSATVTWNAGTDNVGVAGYDWRIDGGSATQVPATPRTLDLTGLTEGTAYTVEIRTRDAAGNVSAYVPLVVTTTGGTETFTIYGASAPTGSWSLGTGETPYITFARGFYKFNSADPTNGLPTGRVVGGRAWIPAGATGLPTQATFYLHGPNANLESAPVQTKVVSLAGVTAGSWVQAMFDTPQDMGADADVWLIGVRFTGGSDAGKYVFGSATRANSDAVVSLSGKHIAWAEQNGPNAALSSQYRVGTGSATLPGTQTESYGVDVLVDAGA